MRQAAQDQNAASMGQKFQINRLFSKSSQAYKNESWDLVDAYEADKEKILAAPVAQLPEEIRDLDENGRAVFIEEKSAERKQVQSEIKDLEEKREAFVAEKRKEMAETKTLDNVMVSAVRKQASENGYKFE